MILLLVAISWGSTFVLVQDAIKDVPVYTFLFWRFFSAFILMGLLSWRELKSIKRGDIIASSILGLLNFSAFAFQTYGLTLTLSSTVAFITGLNVIFIPFIAYLLFRRSISIYTAIGAVIAIVGLWLLTMQESMQLGSGEIFTLICAILVSLHILYTDRFIQKHSVMLLVTIQFGVIAFASAIAGIFIDGTIIPTSYSNDFLLALVITIIFATIFAFWAQTSMQRFTTPAKVALIFTIEPLSAALFGYFYAGETLLPIQMLGGLLIVGGVLFAELIGSKSS